MRFVRDFFIFCLVFVVCAAWLFSGWPQVWHNPPFPPKIGEANAGVGSVYIARAGTTSLISNLDDTENQLTYDDQVQSSADITRQTGNQAFRIQNSGRYLIIANTSFDCTDIANNDRHIVRTQIKVGGSVLPSVFGRASGYCRNSGSANEDGVVVVAYIDHTVSGGSGDDITVHVQNFGDTASPDLIDQIANQSGIQIVRMPDDDAFLRVYRTTDIDITGTLGFGTGDPTWNEFGWETQNDETDTSVIEWVSGNDITLKETGHYLVLYSIYTDLPGGGNNRSGSMYRLRLAGTEVLASRVVNYIRGNDPADHAWTNWAGIIETTATNQVLNIDWGSAAEVNPLDDIEEAAITVVRLPDTASYIRVHHDANRAGETTGVYPLDGESEDDENIHSTSSNTDRINGTSDNYDWLLFGSWFARNATADTTRVTEHMRWSRTGSIQQYGSGLSYHRGDQGADGVPAGGRTAAIVATDLGSSEWMALDLRHESGTGNQNRDFVANRVGVTGVALDTLFTAVISVTITDGSISYGSIANGATQDTVALTDTQVVENDGNVTQIFNIQGAATSDPDQWALVAAAGSDEFRHRYASDGGSTWVALTDSYQLFTAGVAAAGTQALDLEIQVPTSTNATGTQTISVTVQAVQE